jgi:hypothetical protein
MHEIKHDGYRLVARKRDGSRAVGQEAGIDPKERG